MIKLKSGVKITKGIGLGGGVGASYINPDIPAVANIVRAWSLRRNVPEYLLGNSIRADRPSAPVGSPGLLGAFNTAGVIDFPAGADANAYELYDQKGEAGAALVVADGNLANAPLAYSSGAMLKGLYFSNGKILQMAAADETLETALADIATGFTVSFWLRTSSVTDTTDIIVRRSASIGYLDFRITASAIYVRLREQSFRSSGAITANTWVNVCMTVKKSGAYDKRLVYVNAGTPSERVVADVSTVGVSALAMQSNSANIELNDLIVWNRELSADEVATLFEEQRDYYEVSAE